MISSMEVETIVYPHWFFWYENDDSSLLRITCRHSLMKKWARSWMWTSQWTMVKLFSTLSTLWKEEMLRIFTIFGRNSLRTINSISTFKIQLERVTSPWLRIMLSGIGQLSKLQSKQTSLVSSNLTSKCFLRTKDTSSQKISNLKQAGFKWA